MQELMSNESTVLRKYVVMAVSNSVCEGFDGV